MTGKRVVLKNQCIITIEVLYKKLEECEQATHAKKALGGCRQGKTASAVPMVITTNGEESEQVGNDMIGVDSSQLEAHH